MIDLIIAGGQAVIGDAIVQADIAVEEGRIVAIGSLSGLPSARNVIDATGLYVLPGAIDCHVHFRDPGSTYKENWQTGSTAAAAGGVTTVMDMPNTDPATANLPALARKRERAAALSLVDWGLYGVLDSSSLPHLEALTADGIGGFKCFMTENTGDLESPDDGVILEGLERLGRLGVRCSVHAENAAIMQHRRRQFMDAGRADARAHEESRPEVCEIEAIGRVTALAQAARAQVHIAHVSSAGGVQAIRRALAQGLDMTAETCPHYLLFGLPEVDSLAGMVRVNPPIRGGAHADALWDALLDGTIGMIATDHAPHTEEEKRNPDIWKCCRGMIGLETQMQVMLTESQRGRMTLPEYVRWSALAPARAWGLYPRKGHIGVGADADFAIVDMDGHHVIDQSALHSLNRISPWHGRLVTARPVHTLVRGKPVMLNRRVTGEPGWGKAAVPTWQGSSHG
ncbi:MULTISPECIES: allantoinase AllB [unclassified Achromobacter]|uniref:allantoinase AllB n=1 Tax=unclassified Achromobacter TaxID=2626865 RepID=UPI000B51A841|nr:MULTISPECIES: allantoinase AllB [unclassified Achromobacter]OWT80791.1 allantoinase [Achromobacter sp. HZ34]OWT81307.1 allantoinase [Achromobacter sp. HZ28]